MRLFRDCILQGQLHLLPLCLAFFPAYASSTSLPICLQGSIPGSWLAITWAGFTPASLCSLARPQRTSNPFNRVDSSLKCVMMPLFRKILYCATFSKSYIFCHVQRKMALNLPKSGFLTHNLQYQKYVRFLIIVNGLPNTLMA